MALQKSRDKRGFELSLLCCKSHNSLALKFVLKTGVLKQFCLAWQTLTEHPICAPDAVEMLGRRYRQCGGPGGVCEIQRSEIYVNGQLLYNLSTDQGTMEIQKEPVIGRIMAPEMSTS